MKKAKIIACSLAICMVCAMPVCAYTYDDDDDSYSIEVYNDLETAAETTAASTSETSSSDDEVNIDWDNYDWRAARNPGMTIDKTLTNKADAEEAKYVTFHKRWNPFFPDNNLNYTAADAQRATITDQATAQAAMTTVTIPVWQLSGDTKVPATTQVVVMSSLADSVVEIFTEIYNGPEQFPISSIGGYDWRGSFDSLHSSGCAIDINSDQNYQVQPNGNPLVGSCWLPGENPYSIKGDGDVAKAFASHGWYWGAGYSNMDFMHFEAPVGY